MKALVCRSLEEGTLHWQSVVEPQLEAGQLLIQVKAASVNFPDALLVQGKYQIRLQPPFIPGMEISGEVIAMGMAATGFAVGDRVAAVLPEFGGFAERVAVNPEFANKIPPDLPFNEAACVPSVYATAYYGLINRARLEAGETVLVLGAAGGVGMASTSLAKKFGAQVIAVVSSEDKAAVARGCGAHHVINYLESDLKQSVMEFTQGRGVDIVVDPVGGQSTEQALRAISWNGRHLVIGFAAGDIPRVATNLLLLKSAALIGVNFGGFTSRFSTAAKSICEQLNTLMAQDHTLWPVISRVIPMPDGAAAVHSLPARQSVGKIVLTVDG